MTLKLIQIGNSKGIRFPKNIIEKYKFSDNLDMIETEDGVIIKSSNVPRKGWDRQFEIANRSDVVDNDFSDLQAISNEFDSTEWTW